MKVNKYRAWDTVKLKMIYDGLSVRFTNGELFLTHEESDNSRVFSICTIRSLSKESILMQWLGFIDKNECPCYEGDKIKYTFDYGNGFIHTGTIVIRSIFDYQAIAAIREAHELEVVGNIFNNRIVK